MGCLAAKNYDPAALVSSKSVASLLAMTALDTTNLRNTFTAPANGTVLVEMRSAYKGSTAAPQVLLGVLDGSTVRGRQAPIVGGELSQAAAAYAKTIAASFLVGGLTPGNSYSLDAAYGVELAQAGGFIGYGGPDNATANDAIGGFYFAVFDTPNLLYGTLYDPATAATKSVAAALAMTALDTTNLRAQFTTPASGPGSSFVLVRSVMTLLLGSAAAAFPCIQGGIENHTGGAVVARQTMVAGRSSQSTVAATDRGMWQMEFVVPVSPSTAYDWDLAYGVDRLTATTDIKYGGPNNTTAGDAWGGISFEVWGV